MSAVLLPPVCCNVNRLFLVRTEEGEDGGGGRGWWRRERMVEEGEDGGGDRRRDERRKKWKLPRFSWFVPPHAPGSSSTIRRKTLRVFEE
jgi:hypothetical protein